MSKINQNQPSNTLKSLVIFFAFTIMALPVDASASNASKRANKKAYKTITNTINGFVKGSLRVSGKEIANATKKTKSSRSANVAYTSDSADGYSATTNIITKTVNKTVSCHNSGSLTLVATEVIDKVQKAASLDGSLNSNNCNAVTGSAVTSLTAQITSSGASHSIAIPSAVFTASQATCGGTAGSGNVTLNNISINGSFNKSTYAHSSTIQGSVAITCNGQNYLTCNWPSPVPLNTQSAILAGCSGIAIP